MYDFHSAYDTSIPSGHLGERPQAHDKDEPQDYTNLNSVVHDKISMKEN